MEERELSLMAWRSGGRTRATHCQDTNGDTSCGITIPADARIVAGGPLCQLGRRRRAQTRGVDTLPQR